MTDKEKVFFETWKSHSKWENEWKVVGLNGGSYTYHHGDPNKHLVGYIIKKKSPLQIEYSVKSGRTNEDLHMGNEPKGDSYFPLKRKKLNDENDKNSRKMSEEQ